MIAVYAASLLLLSNTAPARFTVHFNTDISRTPIVVEVNRSLSPRGADRFYELVNDRFYDNSAFFRVVPDFVIQFGISGNKTENNEWLHKDIKDDPVLGTNTKGTIAYAAAGPNTRSTQVFINFKNNSKLDKEGFAPFGRVISGLNVALAAHNPTPGNSEGVDQNQYEQRGNHWIKTAYPGINFITSAVVVTNADRSQPSRPVAFTDNVGDNFTTGDVPCIDGTWAVPNILYHLFHCNTDLRGRVQVAFYPALLGCVGPWSDSNEVGANSSCNTSAGDTITCTFLPGNSTCA